MKVDWKVSAIAAIAAFLLSLLIGVIGGVSFGALLLRAIMAGVIFGAGAVGISVVIDRYLPELRTGSGSADVERTSGSVDIVVEGDEPEAFAAVEEIDAEDGTDYSVGLGGEASGSGEFDDEPEELQSDDSYDDSSGASEDGDQLEELPGDESAESIGDEDESGESARLPDVEGFAESFTETPDEASASVDSGSDSATDPATLARAIRTVLKREE